MTATLTPTWTPRIARVCEIDPTGCLFHVGSPNENFRVTRLGGEPEFLRQVLDAIEPGDTFFDVGACVGVVSVHARRRGANVVAFEPEPNFRRRLQENLSLNKMDDISVVDWAVADRPGTLTLYTDGQHGTSPSLTAASDRGEIGVAVDSIDAAIMRGELPTPAVMKIDIEGAEVRAVRGMKRLLASNARPRSVFVEVHPPMIEGLGDDADEMYAIFSDSGYRLTHERTREGQVHHVWRAA